MEAAPARPLIRERYVLTIEALPCDAPAVVRLRRVCKALLRSYRFRLVDVREAAREG